MDDENKYDDVQDENELNRMLAEATVFTERRKLRAALRKLKEKKEAEAAKANQKDYSGIEDIDQLQVLLNDAPNYDEKKRIRAQMREVRKRLREGTGTSSSAPAKSETLRDTSKSITKDTSRVDTSRKDTPSAIRETATLKEKTKVDTESVTSVKSAPPAPEQNGETPKEETSDKPEEVRNNTSEAPSKQSKAVADVTNEAPSKQSKDSEKVTNGDADNLEDIQSMPILEKLLEDTKDFSRRREIRAAMRELRAKIKEGVMTVAERPTTEMSVTQGDDGSVTMRASSVTEGGTRVVKTTVKHSRTPSQSEITEKDTVVTTTTEVPGCGDFAETDHIVTKRKVTSRKSEYYDSQATSTKTLHTRSGSEYTEMDLVQEHEEESVSKDEQKADRTHTNVIVRKPSVEMVLDDADTDVFTEPDIAVELLEALSDVTVTEGEVATLQCKIQGPKEPTVTWYKDSAELKETPSIKQTFTSGVCQLELRETCVDDGGQYTCKVAGGNTEMSTTAGLIVNAREVAPKFIKELLDQTVDDGANVTFSCKVEANPPPTIIWRHNDKLIKSNADFKQMFSQNEAKMVVNEVFPDDNGKYTCIAKNSVGEALTMCTLKVLAQEVAPKFIEELLDQTVDDGANVTFSCKVEANPPPTIIWRHNDKLIKSNADFKQTFSQNEAKMVVNEVFPDDNGDYTCIARNSAGEASTMCTLRVLEDKPSIPEVIEKLKNTSFKDGQIDATLQCVLSSSMTPSIMWYKNNKFLKPSEDFQQTYKDGVAKLVISEVFPEDAGTYECVAMANNEEASTKCKVNVTEITIRKIEAPKFTKYLSDIEVKDGDSVTLKCQLTAGNGTEVKWYKDGKVLRSSKDFKQTYIDDVAKLAIDEVFEDDTGKYRCFAKNESGQDETTCTMTVLEPKKMFAPDENQNQPKIEDVVSTLKKDSKPTNNTIENKSNKPLNKDNKITSNDNKAGSIYNNKPTSDHGGKVNDTTKVKDTSEVKDTVKVTNTIMSSTDDFSAITDEEELMKILNKTENFDDRKKIRARLRVIREQARAEAEKRRQEREAASKDVVKERQRRAEEEKQRKLREFQEMAAEPKKDTGIDPVARRKMEADKAKNEKLESFAEQAKYESSMYAPQLDKKVEKKLAEAKQSGETTTTEETTEDGGTRTTKTSMTTTDKDGTTTITKKTTTVSQTSGVGGTAYAIKKSAEETAKNLANDFGKSSSPGTTGQVSVKTQSWSSRDGVMKTEEKSKSWGGGGNNQLTPRSPGRGMGAIAALAGGPKKPMGARGAMAAFKKMDQATGGGNAPARPNFFNVVKQASNKPLNLNNVRRSAVEIKAEILKFVQANTKDYGIEITNFSGAWSDGRAFCALIHHFYPDAFNWEELDPKKRRYNFTLAFDTAEKLADIAPLLDVEDMVMMKKPDWKCVFTYVQSFYRRFRNHEENADKPAEQ
ncbi:unnamed protein product [Owenia fusiformis]|uniref:Smoothelin n=1 Tax=Owenia fusiformis TaxID=6347 RepID=A0A8S4Q5M1_OWEFU|nr:unnamed protein product [Owenia fusiformis]